MYTTFYVVHLSDMNLKLNWILNNRTENIENNVKLRRSRNDIWGKMIHVKWTELGEKQTDIESNMNNRVLCKIQLKLHDISWWYVRIFMAKKKQRNNYQNHEIAKHSTSVYRYFLWFFYSLPFILDFEFDFSAIENLSNH